MNLSPSRHPVFFAIACLSLLAAWSTPEADVASFDAPRSGGTLALGDAIPPTFRAPAALEADCIAHAGAQRALCVFTATRQTAPAAPTPIHTASAGTSVRIAHRPAADSMHSATKLRDDRTALEGSVVIR